MNIEDEYGNNILSVFKICQTFIHIFFVIIIITIYILCCLNLTIDNIYVRSCDLFLIISTPLLSTLHCKKINTLYQFMHKRKFKENTQSI